MGGGAERAGAEPGGVGLVDVRDVVVGAVDEGDEGGQPAQHLADGEFVEGGDGDDGAAGAAARAGPADRGFGGTAVLGGGGYGGVGVLTSGAGTEPSPRLAWAAACADRAAARRCVPGNRALQRVKFTAFKPRGVARGRCVAGGVPRAEPEGTGAGRGRPSQGSLVRGHSVQVSAHLWSHAQWGRPH